MVVASGSAPQNGGSVSSTNFWTYRAMRGNIQARVLDISRADGTRWEYGSLFVEFIDSSGRVHFSKTLTKRWGVKPGFTVIGQPVIDPVLRLRIAPNTQPGGYAGQWSFFDLELIW